MAADQEHVGLVVEQRGGDGRTVGDDGAGERPRQGVDHGEGRRAAVEDHRGAGLDERHGGGGDATLAVGGDGCASRVVASRRRCGQGASVDPHGEARGVELAQVAADAVFGEAEFFSDLLGDDPSIAAESVEEQVFARSSEHSGSFLFLHVCAVLFRL